jgi:cystathionine beta-lyase
MSQDQLFDFDTVVDRRGTYSLQWDKYQEQDVIPLWLADMDFRSPPAVIAALQRRVEHGVFGYPSVPPELVTVVLSMLQSQYGWEVKPEWLVWLPGLVTGLNVVCRAVAEPEEEVLSAVPIYPPFLSAPTLSGRQSLTLPLIEVAGRWSFDFDRLESFITSRTRLFLLCNPHNWAGSIPKKNSAAWP